MAKNFVIHEVPLSRFGVLVAQLESIVRQLLKSLQISSSVLISFLISYPPLTKSPRRCGKPCYRGCRKVAEFDIQLETEDCVKNSNPTTKDGVNKKGLFKLPRDHHKELEAELKRMAPPNGRAVLIFRGRCGCSVGIMEVPGPK